VVGHKFEEFAFTQKPFSFGKRASPSKTHFLWEKSFALEDNGYYDVIFFLKIKDLTQFFKVMSETEINRYQKKNDICPTMIPSWVLFQPGLANQ